MNMRWGGEQDMVERQPFVRRDARCELRLCNRNTFRFLLAKEWNSHFRRAANECGGDTYDIGRSVIFAVTYDQPWLT